MKKITNAENTAKRLFFNYGGVGLWVPERTGARDKNGGLSALERRNLVVFGAAFSRAGGWQVSF